MQLKSQKRNFSAGFTLVEIIIALGIFVTVVTIALGSLIGLYNANSKSQSLSSVINNLNYAIENMAKTIRFATKYHCIQSGDYTTPAPQNCTSGDTFLAIRDADSNLVFYRFNSSTGKLETSLNNGTYQPITSDEVTIQYARFYVFDTTPGDSGQPRVLMVIKGFAGTKPSTQSNFDIQTTISQRKLDL